MVVGAIRAGDRTCYKYVNRDGYGTGMICVNAQLYTVITPGGADRVDSRVGYLSSNLVT